MAAWKHFNFVSMIALFHIPILLGLRNFDRSVRKINHKVLSYFYNRLLEMFCLKRAFRNTQNMKYVGTDFVTVTGVSGRNSH